MSLQLAQINAKFSKALMYHLYFQNGSGVVVKDVKIDSPVQGKSGLKMGNVIYEINGCNVTSRTDWRSCIIENLNLPENDNNVILF